MRSRESLWSIVIDAPSHPNARPAPRAGERVDRESAAATNRPARRACARGACFKSTSETEMRKHPSTEFHCQCHRKNPCVTANGNPSRMSAPLTGGRRRSTAGLLACGSSSVPGLPGFPVAIDWARTRRLQLRGQSRTWFPFPFPGPRNRTVFPLSPRLRGTVGYTYTFG